MIKTDVLIIGGGAAGLNAAFHLKGVKTLLLEGATSNSVLSPWNMMFKDPQELKEKMLKSGNYQNDPELLEAFFKGYQSAFSDLEKIGFKLKKSNIGLVPDYPLAGHQARQIFLDKLKGVVIKKARVEKFLLDKEKKIRGVKAVFSQGQKEDVYFRYAILAAGGLGGFFPYKTGARDSDGSILSLAYEAGLVLRDIEFFMFHPFLMVDKRFPSLLVSGDILTKMEYEDEKGKPFLSSFIEGALRTNNHHHVFPQMVREFYQQSLRGKIFGRLVCRNDWWERLKKENEFGYIFRGVSLEEVGRIELHPAFHFSIGGLQIDKNGQTSQPHIYAVGEIAGGLHGHNRIGGLAILEALIFSKRAALHIRERIKKEGGGGSFLPLQEIGDLGLGEETKRMVWKAWGPIKRKQDLLALKEFLASKKKLTSQEKLAAKITDICLLRKNSSGAFYREDLPWAEQIPVSILQEEKIIFQ